MSGTDAEEARGLAGEYVLGVLDAAEMAGVRERARGDAGFAAEIRAWEAQLLPMAGAVPPRAPPAALWERIEAAVAPLPQLPANDPGLPMAPAARRRGLRSWPAATAVSLALAAGFAALAFLPLLTPRPGAPAPQFASIAPINAPSPAFYASTEPDGTVVLTAVSPAAVPTGHDLELWVLPPGAAGVAPLGVLPAGGASIRLPARPATGTQLFISLEPAGGSTNGKPTTVLYGGTLTSL